MEFITNVIKIAEAQVFQCLRQTFTLPLGTVFHLIFCDHEGIKLVYSIPINSYFLPDELRKFVVSFIPTREPHETDFRSKKFLNSIYITLNQNGQNQHLYHVFVERKEENE